MKLPIKSLFILFIIIPLFLLIFRAFLQIPSVKAECIPDTIVWTPSTLPNKNPGDIQTFTTTVSCLGTTADSSIIYYLVYIDPQNETEHELGRFPLNGPGGQPPLEISFSNKKIPPTGMLSTPGPYTVKIKKNSVVLESKTFQVDTPPAPEISSVTNPVYYTEQMVIAGSGFGSTSGRIQTSKTTDFTTTINVACEPTCSWSESSITISNFNNWYLQPAWIGDPLFIRIITASGQPSSYKPYVAIPKGNDLSACLTTTGPYNGICDLNHNNTIDGIDYVLWLNLGGSF